MRIMDLFSQLAAESPLSALWVLVIFCAVCATIITQTIKRNGKWHR